MRFTDCHIVIIQTKRESFFAKIYYKGQAPKTTAPCRSRKSAVRKAQNEALRLGAKIAKE